MGKNYSDNLLSNKKYIGIFQCKADVRDIWTVDIGTLIRMRFWSVSNQLGKFTMETLISGQWWTSHQSLACKVLRILRFCVPSIKYCLGTTVKKVQRFITIQNSGHNWRRTERIRVEYFPGFSTLELVREGQKFMNKMWNQKNAKDESSLWRCSLTKNGEMKTMKWNACYLCLVSHEAFPQDVGPSTDWPGSETKWYSTYKKRPGGKWDRAAELMMIKFGESGHPVFRATSPSTRGLLKSKWGGKLSIHFRADGDTIETFSHNHFWQPAIYGAVSDSCEEYGSCRTSTGRLVEAGQSDPFFAPADLLIMTPSLDWDSFTRKSIADAKKKEWKSFHNQINDAGFFKTVKVGQYFMAKHTEEFLHLKSLWHVVSLRYHEMTNQQNRKVGSLWTPKLDPYWKSQPVTHKVNTEWKSELNLWTKATLTRGSAFLMAWTSWSQTWSTRSTTTTSRRLLQRRRKYLRLHTDPRLKQNRRDPQLLFHLQRWYLFLKGYGLILNQVLNSIKLTQWQKERTLFIDIGDWKMIFRTNFSTLNIGLMYGRARWREAEALWKDFNAVLIRQDKKFLISELFKAIQDAIFLIPHCRTMC